MPYWMDLVSSSKKLSTIGSSFFFQAEDGIRDIGVTGVQTCALPISLEQLRRLGRSDQPDRQRRVPWARDGAAQRSEERRVGKECRSGSPRRQQRKNDEQRSARDVDQKRSRAHLRQEARGEQDTGRLE